MEETSEMIKIVDKDPEHESEDTMNKLDPQKSTEDEQDNEDPEEEDHSITVDATNKSKYDILVVDSAAFIKCVRLETLAEEFFTITDVLNEVRDQQARNFMKAFPFEIKTRDPSPEALQQVIGFSKKTGDYQSLSGPDIKILALTWMLEKEMNGTKHLKAEPKKIMFVEPKKKTHKKPEQEEATTPSFDGGWITPENIEVVTAQYLGQHLQPETEIKGENKRVGCITADFSMQNILLQIGLNLVSIDGLKIKQVKQWMLKCFSCNKIERNPEKIFCNHCGNNTLWKIPVVVDEEGNVTSVNNHRRRVNLRGSKFPLPLPKGGRDAHNLILTEDEYQLALKKTRKKKNVDAFDLEYSFASTKAGKHAEVEVGYGKKNPNVARKKVGKNNKAKMNM